MIQSFRVLDPEKSNIIMGAFDFHSALYTPTSTKEEIKQNIKDMISNLEHSASLDSEIKGKARKEQGILRGYLWGRVPNRFTCSSSY
ncbi:hypothetical protein ICU_04702 [Bacillus cereus BAG2X1-1]|nr:hypothetical protein ICU_04702 [Bacillus cereus BAG2X1-1]